MFCIIYDYIIIIIFIKTFIFISKENCENCLSLVSVRYKSEASALYWSNSKTATKTKGRQIVFIIDENPDCSHYFCYYY